MGKPQVSYGSRAGDTVALLYAYRDGDQWLTESIEQPATLWETCCSLALDAQGRPHVSYHVYYDPGFGGGLKVAARR